MFIQEKKTYYNQNDIAYEISNRVGCSTKYAFDLLSVLGDVVKDKFSDENKYVELKLFPGLKVTSEFIPPEQSKSNLNIKTDNLNYILKLSSNFTDDFRRKVRQMHNSYT